MAADRAARSGPVVLITGCTSGGIGHALCRYLAGRGCRVFATARRPEAAGGLQAEGIPVLPLDVTVPESCTATVKAVVAAAGRLDVLVNNAGVVTMGPTTEVPMDVVRRGFDANVFGLLQMCQACYKQMVAQGGGKIVNIGSLTGLQPVPLRGVYSATKAAVQRLTDAMRIELGPLGVQLCYVAPGFIDTRARENAKSNCAPPSGGLFGGWLAVLEDATRARLAKAVPVDAYAKQLGDVVLRSRLPRSWIGRCAGLEWLPRWMPAGLRDRVLAKELGIKALLPQMKANAAALQLGARMKGGEAGQQGGGGGGDAKKAR